MKDERYNNHYEPKSRSDDPKKLHQELKIAEERVTHFSSILAEAVEEMKIKIENPTNKGICNNVGVLGLIRSRIGLFQF